MVGMHAVNKENIALHDAYAAAHYLTSHHITSQRSRHSTSRRFIHACKHGCGSKPFPSLPQQLTSYQHPDSWHVQCYSSLGWSVLTHIHKIIIIISSNIKYNENISYHQNISQLYFAITSLEQFPLWSYPWIDFIYVTLSIYLYPQFLALEPPFRCFHRLVRLTEKKILGDAAPQPVAFLISAGAAVGVNSFASCASCGHGCKVGTGQICWNEMLLVHWTTLVN